MQKYFLLQFCKLILKKINNITKNFKPFKGPISMSLIKHDQSDQNQQKVSERQQQQQINSNEQGKAERQDQQSNSSESQGSSEQENQISQQQKFRPIKLDRIKVQDLTNKQIQKSEQNIHSTTKNQVNNQNLKQSPSGKLPTTYKQQTKANRSFYEQTFYITGMKQNYLLLLSDNNQVLQFPIGMFTSQSSLNNSNEKLSKARNQESHLNKDIKIGQPIRVKLEFDYLRQEKDQFNFNRLQKNIYSKYSQKE